MSRFLTLKELQILLLESQILAWLERNTLLLTDKQLVTLYLHIWMSKFETGHILHCLLVFALKLILKVPSNNANQPITNTSSKSTPASISCCQIGSRFTGLGFVEIDPVATRAQSKTNIWILGRIAILICLCSNCSHCFTWGRFLR